MQPPSKVQHNCNRTPPRPRGRALAGHRSANATCRRAIAEQHAGVNDPRRWGTWPKPPTRSQPIWARCDAHATQLATPTPAHRGHWALSAATWRTRLVHRRLAGSKRTRSVRMRRLAWASRREPPCSLGESVPKVRAAHPRSPGLMPQTHLLFSAGPRQCGRDSRGQGARRQRGPSIVAGDWAAAQHALQRAVPEFRSAACLLSCRPDSSTSRRQTVPANVRPCPWPTSPEHIPRPMRRKALRCPALR
mmetsp:Transcript_110854/g.318484  ORF Transcript_110854/g.318484 Transcript_110854/m.318484 type:complete len:248 (+) Transcript_110854:3929-4672(+)